MSTHPALDVDTVRASRRAGQILVAAPSGSGVTLSLNDPGGTTVELALPDIAVRALGDVLELMGQGHSVQILGDDDELTTSKAAGLLHVSRAHLIAMLERNEMPFHRVGSHRRVRLADILAFKRRRDDARRAAREEVTGPAQELGAGD